MSYCAHCGTEVAEATRFCPNCGNPPSGLPVAQVKSSSKTALILLVVAVVGIGAVFVTGMIAAIAIPNLLNAIDRGKQKRTMADLRSIGTAVEAYALDYDAYPVASDLEELKTVLEPTYIKTVPTNDGWMHAITFEPSEDPGFGYTLRSPGKDGTFEDHPWGGSTGDFDCDIIFADGEFVQWPEGMQN